MKPTATRWPGYRETARRAADVVRLGVVAHPWCAAATLVTGVVAGVATVATAWLTKLLLDRLATGGDRTAAVWLAIALAGVGAMALALQHVGQYAAQVLQRAVSATVQRRLFAAVCRFVGLRPLEEPRRYDQLRLAEHAGEQAPRTVTNGAVGLIRSVVQVTGFVTALWVLWPPILLFAVAAAVPALVADLRLAGERAALLEHTSQSVRRRLFYRTLLTDASAAQEIRLFGTGDFLFRRMDAVTRAANDAENRHDARQVRMIGGLGLLGALAAGAGLVVAVLRAAAGDLSTGDVVLVVAALAGVQTGLTGVASDLAAGYEALLTFGNYRAVTTAPSDLPTGTAPAPRLSGGVEFRDVWFRYAADGPWVLRGVSFTIARGSSVGLVGENGAGKSTLVKLLCRFYDPDRGQILWDGVDIRTIDSAALRGRIGAVFQDFTRYDLTVAENIALGSLDALDDRDRITRAARLVDLDRHLSTLPHGYDSLLSRVFFVDEEDAAGGGTLLSGGQWQRLAVARSLVRDGADLLILDEASAGLDANAEHHLHRALREHSRDRTNLLVSHRLSTMRDADRILVLDGGHLVEQGDHDALMAADGVYARLFTLQASGYQELVA
ncbi:ABC transporter ATP-binding protein [Virgisporangium aurantiacum]|uniref:Multidrug ABC transporter permease n=1 Tax=Virgisporangium aurantiacum TaxID=175570 RepID=A0A8J4E3C6_9ACTN|nr:ABC transporter ATP-binding protein [Virgisporangium aurantiacum]GIJ57867.1 multidrug ABC transporter permease [Virgisporangium aurantiacum]